LVTSFTAVTWQSGKKFGVCHHITGSFLLSEVWEYHFERLTALISSVKNWKKLSALQGVLRASNSTSP
jgi:hypothetical protein